MKRKVDAKDYDTEHIGKCEKLYNKKESRLNNVVGGNELRRSIFCLCFSSMLIFRHPFLRLFDCGLTDRDTVFNLSK